MFTFLSQICCSHIIPLEVQRLKFYLQPQLLTPVCLPRFHPTQPILIREEVMYVNGECKLKLQFSVQLENFKNLITKFGFIKLKKKETLQENYVPELHKPSYIRIPLRNENVFGFTIDYTTFAEEYTQNPKIIQQISISSPVIVNVDQLKNNSANFLMFLEFKPQDNPENFAFQFCVIAEHNDTYLVYKIVKHVYSQPFKIIQGTSHNLNLIYVDPNEYHCGI